MDGSARVGSHVAQLTWLAPGASRLLPDFLIICPPKTGSTWLAANLSCHPEVFIPQVKEVKYFSVYHKWLDLNWYARHFQDGGTRRRGEASPSYSLLPCQQIQLIRLLIPDVKLIFLMRDPVARAWSHAKHNHRYREANFRAYTGDIETVSDHAWRENFRHPWPLLSGDYLGQLRRWLSVFPREQIFVDLYERIGTDPLGLLSRIFEFVGVSTKVDWSSFRTHEIILPGAAKTISERFKHELRLLLQDRTRELSSFVHEQFGLSVMGDWVGTYGEESGVTCERHYGIDATAGGDEQAQARGPAISAEYRAAERTDHCNVQLDRQATTPDGWHGAILPVDSSPALFAHESDDEYLDTLLQEIDLNNPKIIEKGYHGYSIVFYRGRFLALADGLGDEDKDGMIRLFQSPVGIS